ncbi:MAG: 50S ribosomal protein L4 [archaeon]
MNVPIMSPAAEAKGTKTLPKQFSEPVRLDLIRKAVLLLQAGARQPYGAHPEAGMQVSAKLSRRRRDYKTSYGHGISRVPRKVLSVRGTRFNWVGAEAPGMVKGRRAHPPKVEKLVEKKMNKQERRKAIRSALAATLSKELVKARGHMIPDKYPFLITDDFEQLKSTKQVVQALTTLGFSKDLERAQGRKIRAGKGKTRGRKYKVRTSVLLVVSKDCPLLMAARNIPGVDITTAQALNAELLAPGCTPGRATLYSESSISVLEKLFGGNA